MTGPELIQAIGIPAGGAEYDSVYDAIREYFLEYQCFFTVADGFCTRVNWPKHPGAYVIRHVNQGTVYIGMTGKVANGGLIEGQQTFVQRKYRWTPYRFDCPQNQLRLSPEYAKGESRGAPPAAGYGVNIPFGDVVVDCICCPITENIAPAFVEALLLQMYLNQYGHLPLGNQAF